MNTSDKPEIPPDALAILECLRQTAEQTLERKRRLGHYAVIWQDGRTVLVGDDAPESDTDGDPSL
ncbi:hypothetical protein PL263_00350 [Methylomonas sp. EFPC3]|uniref:hypothetical protein n=1 Tax=Methylomonas sp. EFPC3 TaxID=3021710 RepID=UPI002416817D|nr:hypothetical protein [Methylomonas sp. EFPC3]WFP50491.1 hypothetical protein PL263_00350 [Methylomonas sp. EFPC3]